MLCSDYGKILISSHNFSDYLEEPKCAKGKEDEDEDEDRDKDKEKDKENDKGKGKETWKEDCATCWCHSQREGIKVCAQE